MDETEGSILNLQQYADEIELHNKTELDKAKYLCFYEKIVNDKSELSISDITKVLVHTGNSRPNVSRLKKKLINSRDFIKGSRSNTYSLNAKSVANLKKELDFWQDISTCVISNSELLDESLLMGKRGYIDNLVTQINACYGHNLCDGCAVLMRRLFEVLLILSYENLKIQNEIKNKDDTYKMLSVIVANAKNNKALNFSRTKNEFDKFCDIGNRPNEKFSVMATVTMANIVFLARGKNVTTACRRLGLDWG